MIKRTVLGAALAVLWASSAAAPAAATSHLHAPAAKSVVVVQGDVEDGSLLACVRDQYAQGVPLNHALEECGKELAGALPERGVSGYLSQFGFSSRDGGSISVTCLSGRGDNRLAAPSGVLFTWDVYEDGELVGEYPWYGPIRDGGVDADPPPPDNVDAGEEGGDHADPPPPGNVDGGEDAAPEGGGEADPAPPDKVDNGGPPEKLDRHATGGDPGWLYGAPADMWEDAGVESDSVTLKEGYHWELLPEDQWMSVSDGRKIPTYQGVPDNPETPEATENPDAAGEDPCFGLAQSLWECNQAGWKTGPCVALQNTLNGCADMTIVNPGPDGDVTCAKPNADPESVGRAVVEACGAELKHPGSPDDPIPCPQVAGGGAADTRLPGCDPTIAYTEGQMGCPQGDDFEVPANDTVCIEPAPGAPPLPCFDPTPEPPGPPGPVLGTEIESRETSELDAPHIDGGLHGPGSLDGPSPDLGAEQLPQQP